MDPIAIFLTQLVMSLVVWTLVARYLLAYQIEQLGATTALSILLIPHMLRHLGLTFLAPGVVGSAMPEFFSTTAGIGDLAAAVVAIVAFLSLQLRWGAALGLVLLANVVGIIDLANALRQAEAIPHFGATWFIPTFYVPVLLVSHAMMVRILYRETLGKPRVFSA